MITSRRRRLAGHVVCLGEKRYTYTVMVGKPEHRWENNIIVGLTDIG
jgi:hypothetical protein